MLSCTIDSSCFRSDNLGKQNFGNIKSMVLNCENRRICKQYFRKPKELFVNSQELCFHVCNILLHLINLRILISFQLLLCIYLLSLILN